jgi:hypothetical protein
LDERAKDILAGVLKGHTQDYTIEHALVVLADLNESAEEESSDLNHAIYAILKADLRYVRR